MFAAIGAAFALIAHGLKFGDTVLIQGYAMGTPARMGPAYFPFWLGVILFVLGAVIAIGGLREKGQAVATSWADMRGLQPHDVRGEPDAVVRRRAYAAPPADRRDRSERRARPR